MYLRLGMPLSELSRPTKRLVQQVFAGMQATKTLEKVIYTPDACSNSVRRWLFFYGPGGIVRRNV